MAIIKNKGSITPTVGMRIVCIAAVPINDILNTFHFNDEIINKIEAVENTDYKELVINNDKIIDIRGKIGSIKVGELTHNEDLALKSIKELYTETLVKAEQAVAKAQEGLETIQNAAKIYFSMEELNYDVPGQKIKIDFDETKN